MVPTTLAFFCENQIIAFLPISNSDLIPIKGLTYQPGKHYGGLMYHYVFCS